jgi:aspartokinase
MIDAQVRSEEKFSKISIAYEGEEEAKLVCSKIDEIIARHGIKPETYTCNISKNKDVIVIEYHDDVDREAGDIFEEMIKELHITKCD